MRDTKETKPVSPGRKPEWLKKRLPAAKAVKGMEGHLRPRDLHTVCESALCPNKGECFGRGTATFLIMGNECTRDCRFCSVQQGRPSALDSEEPAKVAAAAADMGLQYVVVTSVTRDDLPDGGAAHFAATIEAVRRKLPGAGVEVLVPDFSGELSAVNTILQAEPDVFNHNVETVPRLYETVRPQADYERSLRVLAHAAGKGRGVIKTGLMVGLGEEEEEVREVMRRVCESGVRVVTVGQYLRPTRVHLPVVEYVTPDTFGAYAAYGSSLGLQVEAGPFVRSSYLAEEAFARLGVTGETTG